MRLRSSLPSLALAHCGVAAQTATRRSTNLASLVAYPGFYHGRPILIVGTVTTTESGMRVSDDSGSIRLLTKGSAPDGLDEVRGEFWDIGRMKPDDPQLANFDLKRTFNIDATGSWPRPGEVTVDRRDVRDAGPAADRRRRSGPSRCIRRAIVDQKVTVTGPVRRPESVRRPAGLARQEPLRLRAAIGGRRHLGQRRAAEGQGLQLLARLPARQRTLARNHGHRPRPAAGWSGSRSAPTASSSARRRPKRPPSTRSRFACRPRLRRKSSSARRRRTRPTSR